MVEVRPPRYLMLQCVSPASNGGENLLSDAKAMFNKLAHDKPEVLQVLMRPSLCISRDDMMAMNVPVFNERQNNVFSIKYRSDEKAYILPEAKDAVDFFHANYISNTAYQKEVPLKANQILIIDNHRILHGRKAFQGDTSGRKLRRAWIGDLESKILYNFQDKPHANRSINIYEPYGMDAKWPYMENTFEIKTGIEPAGKVLGLLLNKKQEAMYDANTQSGYPLSGNEPS